MTKINKNIANVSNVDNNGKVTNPLAGSDQKCY